MPTAPISSCHVPALNDVAPVRDAFAALCAEIAGYGWTVAYERPLECAGLLHYELQGPSEHVADVERCVAAMLDALRASGHHRGPGRPVVEPVASR
jgi:hypothetical protein